MGGEGVCDGTGLVLRLGYEGWASARVKLEPSLLQLPPCSATAESGAEPSLSLSLLPEVEAAAEARVLQQLPRPSSPHSAVSSFSGAYPASSGAAAAAAKREKDAVSEEVEVERGLSGRGASDEDEEGGSARKKLRLTKAQSALLEDMFREHSTLNPKQKQALAKQLNLRPRQVEVWFQNRRARTKLKQTEMDCELLRRCCESLTDENRRLHKELQELKALRFASPAPAALYMAQLQPPAPAALSMCPSCERIGAGAAAGGGDGVVAKGGAAGGAPFPTAIKPHFYHPFAAHPPPAAC